MGSNPTPSATPRSRLPVDEPKDERSRSCPGEAEKQRSPATKGADEPADEIETTKAARAYHAQTQAELDAVTAALAAAKTKHSLWTVVILAAAVLATVAAIMFQQ